MTAAEALVPGTTKLDLWAGANLAGVTAGASLEHRFNQATSAFIAGEARWNQFQKIDAQATAGLRFRW